MDNKFKLKEDLRGKSPEYINLNYPSWFVYALKHYICFIDARGLFVKYPGGNRGVKIGDTIYVSGDRVLLYHEDKDWYGL